MTKQEVIKILALIESVYSYCITKEEMVTYWFEICSELDYEQVIAKLKNHIRKSPYPPAIADLAVFTLDSNEYPVNSEKHIEEVRVEIGDNLRNGKQKPFLPWMYEYSLVGQK